MTVKLAPLGTAKPVNSLAKIVIPLGFSALAQLIKALNSKGLRPFAAVSCLVGSPVNQSPEFKGIKTWFRVQLSRG